MKTCFCVLALLMPVLRLAAADAAFRTGCETYTFNRFTVFEAVEKAAQAGAKCVEFYPGQALSPTDRTGMSATLTDAQIAALKQCLQSNGVEAVSYYTDIPRDEAGARKVFEFARSLGAHYLTTESDGSIDTIEKLVKEFDMRVGFHEHGKTADANYKLWNPEYLRDLVKNRDPRIGACGDTGHWVTSGIKPLDAVKILEGRMINVHLKDRPELGRQRPDVVLGTGVSDIAGVLAELRRQKFDGYVLIEYEANFANNVAEVKQCLEFVRNFKDAKTP